MVLKPVNEYAIFDRELRAFNNGDGFWITVKGGMSYTFPAADETSARNYAASDGLTLKRQLTRAEVYGHLKLHAAELFPPMINRSFERS